MSSAEARRYRLTPRALEDLDEIWRYSAETWSIAQADRYVDELVRAFEALAAFPSLARERHEFSPPVRIHVHLDQLIIYVLVHDRVDILRLLGGRQDWVSILRAAED
jgi:toxin ParE1/3/4